MSTDTTTIESLQPAAAACLPDLAARANEAHAACEDAARSALTHALEAGELLLQVKAALPHGRWTDWLADHFAGSARTAQLYMRLARNREALPSDPQRVAELTVREAVALLAHGADGDEQLEWPILPVFLERLREAHVRLRVATFGQPGGWTQDECEEFWLHCEVILGCLEDDEDAAQAWSVFWGVSIEAAREKISFFVAKSRRFIEMDPFGKGSGRLPASLGEAWDWARHREIMALPTRTPEEQDIKDRAIAAFWESTPERVRRGREERERSRASDAE